MNLKMWNILYSKGNYVKKIYYTICGYSKRLYDLLILRNYDVIYIFNDFFQQFSFKNLSNFRGGFEYRLVATQVSSQGNVSQTQGSR